MASKERFLEVVEQLRKDRVRVSYRNVNERLYEDGPGLSNNDLKDWLREWNEETGYDPVVEVADMPDVVRKRLRDFGVDMWKAARAQAKGTVAARERRAEAIVQAERALCDEAAALADASRAMMERLREEMATVVDARDFVIEAQRGELTWYAAELDRTRELLRDVRASEYWDRVVREIHALLPEGEALHVREITGLVGADLVAEAAAHAEAWSSTTVRKKMEQRIFHKRLFAREGKGLYRRRRPDDDRLVAGHEAA